MIEEIRNDPLFDKQRLVHKTSVHVAILVCRGKIISKASNQLGTRSSGCGFSNCSIHAERNVIKKIGDTNKIKGADLYVFRRNSNGNFTNSTPCDECHCFLVKCMERYGLRNVYFTTDTTTNSTIQ